MIDLSLIKGSGVAVLGLGRTGLVAANALKQSGVRVAAWDDSEAQRAAAAVEILDLNIADLSGFEYLLLSPGIPHTHPVPHPVVTRARAAGLKIVSDIELLVQADPAAKYICVTGTNGKSTTTALIGHILRANKIPCQTGGNLGQGVLGFDQMGAGGVYVIEMSSYQLELTPSLAPDVAVLLNITPDHLGRHGGMEGYVTAKKSIFRKGARHQIAVIGIDDEPCRAIARTLAADHHFEMNTISLAGAQATIMVDDGVMNSMRSGMVTDISNIPAMRGPHNWQNMAAAYAAACGAGLASNDVLAAIRTFPGLAHRQQLVATIGGVAYVNDSKATNAEAAEKALSAYQSIYWIVGGQAKEGGLNGLESLMPRVRLAYLIGEAQEQFAEWLQVNGVTHTWCGTLEKAMEIIQEDLDIDGHPKGAVVLLSPACASWDQFKSFEHRGEVFIELVRALEGVA